MTINIKASGHRAQGSGRRGRLKTALQDNQTIRQNMYTTEILQYLIWPGFIILAWFVIKFVLAAWERKFPEKE
jgi:hypothetical protein